MRSLNVFCLIIIFPFLSAGQELYIMRDPASTIPKNVFGLRAMMQSYKEINRYRNLYGLQMMYGVLPSLTLSAQATVTNHHGKNFPAGLVTHTHDGEETIYSTGEFQRGLRYPHSFAGIYINARWRFLSIDAEHEHLRMAAYGEWAWNEVAHDEAEPNLMDDTKGGGGGVIVTALKNKFAASVTAGGIFPSARSDYSPDLAGGPLVPTRIHYGNAFAYSLSCGYLLLPFKYKNYNQTNVNLYIELLGKAYGEARVYQYDTVRVAIQTPLLEKGNYIEVYPGIQFIIRSNLRIDLSAGFPLVNESFARTYPLFHVALQRYFF